MAIVIGVAIGLFLVLIWLLYHFFQIRSFNRSVYLRVGSEQDGAVGMCGGHFTSRHYALVTVDNTNRIVTVKYYDATVKKPRFDEMARWSGISLNILLEEAMHIKKPIGYAVIRAIHLLTALTNSQGTPNIKSTVIDCGPTRPTKFDELSECIGYVIAPHVANVLSHKILQHSQDR